MCYNEGGEMIGWHEIDAGLYTRYFVLLNGLPVSNAAHRIKAWGLPFLGLGEVWRYEKTADGGWRIPLISKVSRGVVFWFKTK